MIKHSLMISLLISGLAASSADQEQTASKGSKVATALIQKLGGEVKNKMQTGGAPNALQFCSQNALILTDELGRETDTVIKRVSLKNRNPVNIPDDNEELILLEWEKQLASGAKLPEYILRQGQSGKSIYYKPLIINNEACLKCHGALEKESELLHSIRSIYPEDKATGYKMGDLRGMIVITIPR